MSSIPTQRAAIAEEAVRIAYREGEGFRKIRTWLGLPAAVNSLVPPGFPLEVDTTPEPPLLRKTATYSCDEYGNEDPSQYVIRWEPDYNYIEKSIFNKLTQSQAEIAKRFIAQVEEESPKTLSQIWEDAGNAGGVPEDVGDAVDLYLTGTEFYEVIQPIARKMVTFDWGRPQWISFDNVNKIYTPAQFVAEEPTVTTVPFSLPQNGYWLKRAPKVSASTAGKYELTQEWWWVEDYSTFLYDAKV